MSSTSAWCKSTSALTSTSVFCAVSNLVVLELLKLRRSLSVCVHRSCKHSSSAEIAEEANTWWGWKLSNNGEAMSRIAKNGLVVERESAQRRRDNVFAMDFGQ